MERGFFGWWWRHIFHFKTPWLSKSDYRFLHKIFSIKSFFIKDVYGIPSSKSVCFWTDYGTPAFAGWASFCGVHFVAFDKDLEGDDDLYVTERVPWDFSTKPWFVPSTDATLSVNSLSFWCFHKLSTNSLLRVCSWHCWRRFFCAN